MRSCWPASSTSAVWPGSPAPDSGSTGLPFPKKVAMVARILDEDGYLADFTELPDGSFRLTEHNCAVLAIAQRYQHACRTEIEFLQALLPEADVVRVAHRLKSGHICSYEITRARVSGLGSWNEANWSALGKCGAGASVPRDGRWP